MDKSQLRSDFEALFPIPEGIHFDGVADYDVNYGRDELVRVCDDYNGIWKGFQAGRRQPVAGDQVSVDVSTCDEDSHRRIFALIEGTQEDPDSQSGYIYLARMIEDSFGLLVDESEQGPE